MDRTKSLYLTLFVYGTGFILFFLVNNYLLETGESVLVSTFLADVVFTIYVFIFSVYINNSSIYDPYWSVLPPVIAYVWISELGQFDFLTNVLYLGIMIWAIRLTRNWYIDFKGYNHEDFRYVNFRNQFKGMYWVISFLGIHLFPTVIVFVSLYPVYVLLTGTILYTHYIFIGTMVMILAALIQFISDMQRREFKKENPNQSIQHGLWAYSRHPNYFGEVLFWTGVYITSLSIGFSSLALIGVIGMILLFNFYSVPAMEKKLLGNKPDYQEVIERVPRFFIRFPKRNS